MWPTIYRYLWYFVLYAFLGWCLEEVFCTVTTGKLVNRGFLNGPVCPIYGFGMVLVTAVLGGVTQLWQLYLLGALLTSAVELLGGWLLKKLFHTRWWDYSAQPFNLGGYICLKMSLAWGVAVVAAVRGVHPPVSDLISRMPYGVGVPLLAVLLALFAADAAVTVLAIRKIDRSLGVLDDIAHALHYGSETLGGQIGTAALAADEKISKGRADMAEKVDAGKAVIAEKKQAIAARVEEGRAAVSQKIEAGKDAVSDKMLSAQMNAEQLREAWLAHSAKWQRRIHARLLRAFPQMQNMRHTDALRRVQAWYKERRQNRK